MSNAPSTKSQPQPDPEDLYRAYLDAFIGYLTPRTSHGQSPSRPGRQDCARDVVTLRAHAMGLRDAVAVERMGLICEEVELEESLPLSQDDFEAAMGLKAAASVN